MIKSFGEIRDIMEIIKYSKEVYKNYIDISNINWEKFKIIVIKLGIRYSGLYFL